MDPAIAVETETVAITHGVESKVAHHDFELLLPIVAYQNQGSGLSLEIGIAGQKNAVFVFAKLSEPVVGSLPVEFGIVAQSAQASAQSMHVVVGKKSGLGGGLTPFEFGSGGHGEKLARGSLTPLDQRGESGSGKK